MDVGELINSILAEDKMEDTRQYLLRGRRFEHLGIEELNQRWTGSSKACADDIANYEALYDYVDSTAEFQLRNIELPHDAIKADLQKLAAAIPSEEEDPEGWARVRQAIGDALRKREDDTHH